MSPSPPPDPIALAASVLAGDRAAVARAVTLVESARELDRDAREELLLRLAPSARRARRVAVSGPPGAGKSTLIEALGERLMDRGERVAVLAIDPSSSLSGGSILADKTRMTRLSADPRAFVRPSPSSNTLGGVARRTRDAMVVVAAAGFDVVLVETVGVGQSEIEARRIVDTFVLVALPGSGDEIQGIKRGIVEIAHVVVVNKADGDNVARAEAQAREFSNALACVASRGPGTDSDVGLVSAVTGDGVAALLAKLDHHHAELVRTGELERVRVAQTRHAITAQAEEEIVLALRARLAAEHDAVDALVQDVGAARTTTGRAALSLVDGWLRGRG